MITIQILKNEKVIKEQTCAIKDKQKCFEKFVDIAGGMWNGIDTFKVVIK